jgi:hypothetical protein
VEEVFLRSFSVFLGSLSYLAGFSGFLKREAAAVAVANREMVF